MARIYLIVFGMMSLFFGAVLFRQGSEAEREAKAMKAAMASGKARKTQAVVVAIWEAKTKHGRKQGGAGAEAGALGEKLAERWVQGDGVWL